VDFASRVRRKISAIHTKWYERKAEYEDGGEPDKRTPENLFSLGICDMKLYALFHLSSSLITVEEKSKSITFFKLLSDANMNLLSEKVEKIKYGKKTVRRLRKLLQP
jgi:hypothetical protein